MLQFFWEKEKCLMCGNFWGKQVLNVFFFGGKSRISGNVFRTFAAGNKIKQFYELLVEDSLQREDVENMSRCG